MLRKSEYRDMEKFKRTKREQQKRYYRKTQNAPNRNKRWTEEETAMIMNVRDMTDTELSRILGSFCEIDLSQTAQNKIWNIIRKRRKIMLKNYPIP